MQRRADQCNDANCVDTEWRVGRGVTGRERGGRREARQGREVGGGAGEGGGMRDRCGTW